MLRAILNRSWKQHPTKQQPYGHLVVLISQTMLGTAGEVRTNSSATFSNRVLRLDPTELVEQQRRTYICSARPLDAVQRTYQERFPIGTDYKWESKESLLLLSLYYDNDLWLCVILKKILADINDEDKNMYLDLAT